MSRNRHPRARPVSPPCPTLLPARLRGRPPNPSAASSPRRRRFLLVSGRGSHEPVGRTAPPTCQLPPVTPLRTRRTSLPSASPATRRRAASADSAGTARTARLCPGRVSRSGAGPRSTGSLRIARTWQDEANTVWRMAPPASRPTQVRPEHLTPPPPLRLAPGLERDRGGMTPPLRASPFDNGGTCAVCA